MCEAGAMSASAEDQSHKLLTGVAIEPSREPVLDSVGTDYSPTASISLK